MARNLIQLVGALSVGALALPAMACELPKLPLIPAADAIGDRAPAVSEATAAYFEGMRSYAACLEGELQAAGGDAAPASVKAVIAARSNAAVAEATAIQKLFQERVAAGQTATPGSEAALRKLIEGVASGTVDYDALTPQYARMARQQFGFLQGRIAALGAIRNVTFGGVDPEGRDIYQVEHENGTLRARIGLDDESKIDFAMLQPPPGARPQRRRTTKSY
jgi:hypothetical protein